MPEAAYKNGSLTGLRILVTRPAHQSDHLIALIEQAGGEAIRFPVIEIRDLNDTVKLARIVDRLEEFAVAIFISANAVHKALNLIQIRRGGLPKGLTVACAGRGSAYALKHFGVTDPLVPPGRFDSEGLLALPTLQDVRGKRIVIFRGDGGRELLGQTLTDRGARIEYAECYRRMRPHADPTPLLHQWARGAIHAVCVTSVSGVRNLYDMVGEAGRPWLLQTPAVVVSERIAQTCRELGFKIAPIVAAEASDEAIVTAVKTWREAQNSL